MCDLNVKVRMYVSIYIHTYLQILWFTSYLLTSLCLKHKHSPSYIWKCSKFHAEFQYWICSTVIRNCKKFVLIWQTTISNTPRLPVYINQNEQKIKFVFQKTHRDRFSREIFTCHLCPQTFLYTRSLSGHVKRVHGKERNYQCKFCRREFSQKSALKTHTDAQHTSREDPRYSCGSCEYRTCYKSNLVIHELQHDVDRKNQLCYFCGKSFTTFYGLAAHGRKFHTLEK